MATLLWFRSDLRLTDNPALAHALAVGESVYPLFIKEPEGENPWALGGASRWWLHYALEELDKALSSKGLRLIIREGDPQKVLDALVKETKATHLCWNRCYEPHAIKRDTELKRHFIQAGLDVSSFNANLLVEPPKVANKSGKPFQVYTPFWKHCLTLDWGSVASVSWKKQVIPSRWPKSDKLSTLGLLPKIRWDKGLKEAWDPSAQGLKKQLRHLKKIITSYSKDRDYPAIEGTSCLSPYLHFGQISPREIIAACGGASAMKKNQGAETYLKELFWREFAYHLLYHFPHTPKKPLRPAFEAFPWRQDKRQLKAWQAGQTGYPLVDAGMRQLYKTGWMHNRVRMVVGSFLVKNLLLDWQHGARWFWDTLVDADLASNTLGWQWVGGCGADAAPYFRVFNPITQSERFDEAGDYIRTYVPELAKLPDKFIHQPWLAPEEALEDAGVRLGETYPRPIVDAKESRQRALEAYQAIKKTP
tara:strand:- start:33834 stop:35261 length:1428 start_codon:yes stop_codon:yes gene_type:complete